MNFGRACKHRRRVVRRRTTITTVVAALGMLVTASIAAADDSGWFPVHLTKTVASEGHPVIVNVNAHERFLSMQYVCFSISFENDLLDPGEVIHVTPLKLYPSLGGPGFSVFSPPGTSMPGFSMCLLSSPGYGYQDMLQAFADGKEQRIEIGVEHGSVQISHVDVSMGGTPR